jgi:hypothetical protein
LDDQVIFKKTNVLTRLSLRKNIQLQNSIIYYLVKEIFIMLKKSLLFLSSATIDISGKMTVDAIHASSGIHVNASLYTSTEINGNATYKEGEGIKLSVEPPTKPVYIVNVK